VKFTVPARAFQPAYSAALAAAAKRTTKPVLTHVKCTAEADGTVTLQGTNGDLAVVARLVGVTVERPGEVILNGPKTAEAVGLNRTSNLTIDAGDSRVEIRAADPDRPKRNSEYRWAAIPVAEFPDVAGLIDRTAVVAVVKADDVRAMVRRAGFAAAKEIEQEGYDTTGVAVQVGGGWAMIGSMHRELAAYARVRVLEVAEGSAVVPPEAIDLLSAVLPGGGEGVEIRFAPGDDCRGVAFSTPLGSVWTRTTTARVLARDRVVPPTPPLCGWLNGLELLDAAHRASPTTGPESVRVRVTVGADGGLARTDTPDVGRSEAEFDAEGFAGEPVNLGVNWSALKLLRRAFAGESAVRVEVHQKGDHRKLVVRVGDESADGVAVVQGMADRDD
jgi:DNA polymerase III sliding clamp (beta) subunit (PCNA family)